MPVFIDEANKAYHEVLVEMGTKMSWKVPALPFSHYLPANDDIITELRSKIQNINTQLEHLHIPKLVEILNSVDSNIRYELERTIKEEIKNTIVKTLLDTNYE